MRYDNIKVFEDTLNYIKENTLLTESINYSIKKTRIYNSPPKEVNKISKAGKVSVTQSRTFEAAVRLSKNYPNKRIGVLNFASATTPGGGVTSGSSAQEESLCRCSTLYPVLNHEILLNAYYFRNIMLKNPLHDDTVIYTPDIVICKTDTISPVKLSEKDFVKVDVLSCAAPNLREYPTNKYNHSDGDHIDIDDEKLYQIHLSRGKQILDVALFHNIDVLVLGAFGCGAFRNDPRIVAKAYKELLKEYSQYFEEIEFAIYCSKYDQENYEIFKSIL